MNHDMIPGRGSRFFFTSNCQRQLGGPPNLFFSRNHNSHPASQGIGLTTYLNPLLRLQLSSA